MSSLFGIEFNLIFDQFKHFYNRFVYSVDTKCSAIYSPENYCINVIEPGTKEPGVQIDLLLNKLVLTNLKDKITALKPTVEYTVTDYKERKIVETFKTFEEAVELANKMFKEDKRVIMVHCGFKATGVIDNKEGLKKVPALSLLINPLLYIPWDIDEKDSLKSLLEFQHIYCEGSVFIPSISTVTNPEIMTLPGLKPIDEKLQGFSKDEFAAHIADDKNEITDITFYQRFMYVDQALYGIVHAVDLLILQNTFNIENTA